MERQTLKVREVARILGIGLNEAYQWANSGKIPAIRLGKRILVPKVALDAWLRSAGQQGGEER